MSLKRDGNAESGVSSSVGEHETDVGFVERLRLLAETTGSANALAKKAGISQSGLHRYLNGGEPSRRALIAIANAGGVSLDWLATGKEPMRPKDAGQPVAPAASPTGSIEIDEELHGRIVDGIVKLYDAEKVRLQPIDLGRLSMRMYADILAAGPTSQDEQMVALRYALEQLRRQLRTPPTNDTTHKRLA